MADARLSRTRADGVRTHRGRATLFRGVAVLLATLLTAGTLSVLTTTVGPAPRAVAADAANWDPGFIIADSIFYDASSMTATDVQAFLNAKVPTCRSGATCLKSYGMATPSLAGDNYCGSYGGAAYQTAAQIIDGVARACGVNQRVLLVVLQKEQGLVTSTAPSADMYAAATGANCPDTAPCSPATAGFFKQVYAAARLYKWYRGNPGNYAYRANTWVNILESPNCSSRQRVYIANQATAGLYIYTPYVPNSYALANLYGSSTDACASYGNRNFWRLFSDWFGDPHRYEVHPGFVDYWNSRGAAGGVMGPPISYAVYVEENGQGWMQRFGGGIVYGSFQGGTAFIPGSDITSAYASWYGPYGPLGWPNSEPACPNQNCVQSFVSGLITTNPIYHGHAVTGGMADYWKAQGGLVGRLGPALNEMSYATPAAGPGWTQNFAGGVVAIGPKGTFLLPYGALLNQWLATGAGSGSLGWPASDAECAGSGCVQTFQSGTITSTPSYGVHSIVGGYLGWWQANGGIAGIGPAVNDLAYSGSNGGGWTQNFAAGVVAQPRSGGPQLIPYGAIQAYWTGTGGHNGWLGFPTGPQSCSGEFCSQAFQAGIVSSSKTWGVHVLLGGMSAFWAAQGGFATMGAAVSDVRFIASNGGGWLQNVGAGVITQTTTASPILNSYGPILQTWYDYGGPTTWLGWPMSAVTCSAGSCTQQFQHGVARSNPSGGVWFATS